MMNREKQTWDERFRKEGFRFTEPRKIILEVLSNTNEHPSAEDIFMIVRKKHPKIGLTTVYRNLEILECMRIVTKFHFGDGCHRYELVEGNQKPLHHHHLVCTS